MSEKNNLSSTEHIKMKSDGLRGTLKESLKDEITGAIREDDRALVKFHGMYQQDDRDRREERSAKKLEWLYSFMIRLRIPGGFITAEQWEALHHITGAHSTGVIKITTRQTVQLHGILKSHAKPTIQAFNTAKLDSISACGDVNRNVICAAHPKFSSLHEEIFAYSDKLSQLAKPKTKAYYEVWLDEKPLADKTEEADPLYQDRYLPRKFKIGIAIPPTNDVDVFANDCGLIAIEENGKLAGFNIAAGGGMGATHGNAATYPRLATVLGFVPAGEKVFKAVYEMITVQRDYGNRSDRKLSRLKYTLDNMGVEAFKAELEKRCGFTLEPERPYKFTGRTDFYGWHKNHEGKWYYTAFIENGRVHDDETLPLKTAFLEIALLRKTNFRFTCNQNLIIADVSEKDKAEIHAILDKYGIIKETELATPLRKESIACVAYNTCPLALAEAQRYLPTLLGKMEPLMHKYGLDDDNISVRMTGCPNGCARPYAAEIAFIGTSYGRYNLQIGGDREGTRLNRLYKESLDESGILTELDSLLNVYSKDRQTKETFGDFVMRAGLVK
ncbi:NADPH-dependent assimilatory sulfite reductase hemoprotein subunit [Terrimonas sp.]|uniref:NADPH-dependent assimilatory sulfite reductase hemoprotein subunit n=1 Tax=Terrimonas sp. TaxID=1914338 RepID=UPI000D516B8B|nr:NADPH-dependent assimilatory sulfite reductase hemoprotein subunit [Terrimonas sp.]PVD53872.1 NADPH-dependent assimilatory sulfite reductase hemoprotein subunit [Terrimonas sp.]